MKKSTAISVAIVAVVMVGAGVYRLSFAGDPHPQAGAGDRPRSPSSAPAVGSAVPRPPAGAHPAPAPTPYPGREGPSAPAPGGPRPRPPVAPSVGQAVPGVPGPPPPGEYPGRPWVGVPYVVPPMTFGYWGWGDWPYGYSSYPYASSGSYPLTLSGITGEMRLDVTPKDADVYVDGYYAGVVSDFNGTFHHLSVTAGPHVVEFRKDGMETLAVPVFIQPNHTTTYRGSMLPAQPGSSVEETMLPGAPAAGASPWAAPGDLRFDVTPGSAQVYVDGYFVGAVNDFEGRRQRLSLAPGTHHVALQAPGYESTEGDVTIEPRQTTTYKETLAHVKP